MIRPQLCIIQEFCAGGSLERQLYTERWKPNPRQVLEMALGVAKGMDYLHTKYVKNGVPTPLIHRDLKSGNLLLVTAPTTDSVPAPVVKVADFGISTEKLQKVSTTAPDSAVTQKMTGCGTVMWMAPEILLGETYNEKVDVFSYAMCLVELLDRKVPVRASCMSLLWTRASPETRHV